MKGLTKIAILLLGLFWQINAIGQTEAISTIDTSVILIGDQTTLRLQFIAPADYEVFMPRLFDTITSQVEILKHSDLIEELSNNQYDKIYRQSFTITSFDSGFIVIPSFRFNYKVPGDTGIHFTESRGLILQVNSVAVNMEDEFKDIKDPIHAPFTFKEALPYILIFLGVLLVGFLVYYFIKKRKKAEPLIKIPAARKIPAHQAAIEALETLRYKKLWQSGEIKQYHTELTDIIREYLSAKFNIHALEYTTEEIMASLNATASNFQAKEKLQQTLNMADMVKFAKMQPLPLEHDASLNNAIDFVKETTHLVSESDKQIAEVPTFEVHTKEDSETQSTVNKIEKEVKDVE